MLDKLPGSFEMQKSSRYFLSFIFLLSNEDYKLQHL